MSSFVQSGSIWKHRSSEQLSTVVAQKQDKQTRQKVLEIRQAEMRARVDLRTKKQCRICEIARLEIVRDTVAKPHRRKYYIKAIEVVEHEITQMNLAPSKSKLSFCNDIHFEQAREIRSNAREFFDLKIEDTENVIKEIEREMDIWEIKLAVAIIGKRLADD